MVDNERLYTLIGERVRQIRETQTPRMSQEELGRVLGLKRTSVTNIEQGNQKPTLDAIYQLCERFGLQINEVLPVVADVTRAEGLSVTVAGESHSVGTKTASALTRLRPSARTRR